MVLILTGAPWERTAQKVLSPFVGPSHGHSLPLSCLSAPAGTVYLEPTGADASLARPPISPL